PARLAARDRPDHDLRGVVDELVEAERAQARAPRGHRSRAHRRQEHRDRPPCRHGVFFTVTVAVGGVRSTLKWKWTSVWSGKGMLSWMSRRTKRKSWSPSGRSLGRWPAGVEAESQPL